MLRIRILASLVLFLGVFLCFFSSNVLAADGKYTLNNRQRFGVGWSYFDADFNLFKNTVLDLGAGWYPQWTYDTSDSANSRRNAQMASLGVQRLELVMKAPKDLYSSANCQQLKNYVAQYPDSFDPNMTFWSVGNELGYDINLTAPQYAQQFVSWRDCIKSINSKFAVGSGAITSMWVVLPRTYPISCTDINSPKSGKSYFETYIRDIGPTKTPDFIVMHDYDTCPAPSGVSGGIANFKNSIVAYRQAMKELGLQNKELWIKEYDSHGYGDSQFVKDSIGYMVTGTDRNLGDSADGYRLVQRFSWFELKNTPGATVGNDGEFLAKADGTLTSDGLDFKTMERTYGGVPNPPPPPPATKLGDANSDGKVDVADYQIWKTNYGKTGGVAKGNFNSDNIIDGLDYAIWFDGFGK